MKELISPHLTQDSAATEQYSLEAVRFACLPEDLLSHWNEWRPSPALSSPYDDPEWLRGYFGREVDELQTFLLRQGGSIAAAAHFIARDWPLNWHLGEIRVASMPLRRLRLLSPTPAFPDEWGAYDSLFAELARTAKDFDAISLPEVPLDSFLWNYLQTSDRIRKTFRLYMQEPPSRRLLLRLDGSFDDYMQKFSGRHRKHLRRAVSKLREDAPGEVRWVRYTRPEEVSTFLDLAVTVSEKTYQWRMFERGLYKKDLLRNRLMFAAEHGWFRSYMLFLGDLPCSFVAGFQYGGRFDHHEIGYDPAWSRYSVGTVLHLLMIEDLFAVDRPHLIDFGEFATYKEEFATDSYMEAKVILFKPGAYSRLVQTGDQLCRAATRFASETLERWHLKATVKQLIRRVAHTA